ncbi:SDR family NAD(P)-dependent oxidoreductase [Collimonas humicola]|uniref:SDR family NAD(P)-dependent oxidoreductase n=1 Tax=Collimonas humicola TaxID=2825886 RepID=UPI001E3BF2CB|nr:SDR family NAD(P)-dependent oxidoreductase [Collimonas humicola]
MFWANLAERKASISVVPSSRWDWKAYWGDSRTKINKSLSKWGGFIERVDAFDNQFFGVLPKVAQSMDPQQRIMLELTWSCLEDAGIPPSQLRGRKVGVIVGVFNHDYKELQERDEPLIEAHNSTGTATAMIANRVSHYFDFRGPSIPIDTACSSSLNAIHSAIQAMEFGDCEMALAGGINLLLTPTRHISFSKMGMLSPTGTCKTFDDSADGYVRGEGAGLLLLKPLDKALSDGDSIYGVIKGSAVNHCGATYTLTYPSPRAQAEVIVAAHERAGIPVDSVGYIEAHGTGTPKGDPIEFEGLLTAFQTLADKQDIHLGNAFCGLSSVKTNIGHLEAAAGVAGAIKVLMAFKHRTLPALHDFTTLNSKISINETPFYILGETREWAQVDKNKDQPRRAGVSSFGFGGTNAHLVLEEAPPSQHSQKALPSQSKRPSYLIALSAKSSEALLQKQKDISAWLRDDAGQSDLLDISATLLTRREHFQHRFSCIAANVQELIEKLGQSIAIDAGASSVTGQGQKSPAPDAVQAGQKLLKQLSAKPRLKGAKYPAALQQLADLYAEGVDLPWVALFGEAVVKPVSLPTYPFSRDSFWIAESDDRGDADQRQALHPALQRNVSMIGTQRYASTFTGKEFFLADHVIKTQPVLPGVVYLEMVRAAIVDALGADAGSVQLSDVLWMRPLEVGGEPVSVHVKLWPESADSAGVGRQGGTGLAFQVTSAEIGALPQIYCRGSVDIVSAANLAALDIAALKRACDGQVYSAEQCYRSLANLGLNYGPAQQAIAQLHSGTHQCIAQLSLPAQLVAGSEPYVIHPSTADAALQAAVAFVAGVEIGDASATTFLPFALDRLDVYHRCTSAMHAWVRYAPGHSADASSKKIDIDVIDADGSGQGRICLAFRGLSIRPMAADASFAPPTAPSFEARLSPELQQSLYTPVWTTQPIAGAASEEAIDHLLLVGDPNDASWLTQQLRTSSQFASTRIEHLYFGSEVAVEDAGALHVRPGRLEDYEAAVAALASRGGKLDHVLLIAPRLTSDIAQIASDSPDSPVGKIAQNLFALVKAMMRGTKRAKFLHLVSRQPQRPEYQGLSGLYKTLRIEKPSYSGRVVQCDLAELPAQRLAELVFKEFHAADKDVDVSYSDDVRSVRKFRQLDANSLPPATSADLKASLRKEGVYLITGGMGALGLLFARHLCERYQATVFLTGRSAPTEQHRLTLNELSSLGGHASFLTCDVVNRDDVRRAIDSIHAAGHQLNGVIHSAGVIEDDFILRKSPESFARVVAPKTLGTWHLDIETRDEPLDFFALFSSVTGVLGNIGQCDYGFGNAFEDYFAHQRDTLRRQASRHGKTLSINWPYWKEGGMRLTDKEEENLHRSFGLVPLLSAQGIEIFEYALTQPNSQLVVMPGDAAKVQEVLGVVATAMPVAAVVAAAMPAKMHSAPYAHSQSPVAAGDLSTAVARYLAALFAAQLQISSDFELTRSFREYGFDSIVMIDLVNSMEKKFGSLPKTLFFEHQTLGELTAFFIEHHAESCRAIVQAELGGKMIDAAGPVRSESAAMDAPATLSAADSTFSAAAEHDDVAIIGLSGRYPEAESLEQFWENLKFGRDCVVEIPSDRWDIETTFQPGPAVIGKTYSKWGGFLKGVDQFDPLFFNISPKEAENMDPNERLFLETAALTIEDAGYTADKLVSPLGVRENPVGVYVGLMWGDYQLHGVEGQPHTWATPHSFYWAVANRVSHYFNFSGPSITIDTACSSSLTAIHLACAAIRAGEIGVAIAGAVNLSLHINKYNLLSDMHFLSTDGRCRSFGEGGDGYVPGEGVGAVLLKSLARARADGDHIYGIIRGTSVNHGGKTSGFTVPNPKRQAMLVQDALQAAGVNPRHISYLEAHGTGTSLGDPIEIAGLNKAFAQQEHQYCAIGSVKSNIGHLEAASGIAGLTKILLQMKHRTLAPSIQSDVLNPYIDFKNCPFRVQRTLQEWSRPWLDVTDQDGSTRRMELPRLAGISSFGAGGSNAHLIVEEYTESESANDQDRDRPALITLSARKEAALKAMAENLAAFVEANPELSLQDAAYTLQTGRVAMEHRLAVVALRGAQLVAALRAYVNSSSSGTDTDLFSGHRDQAKAAASAPPVAQWLAQGDLPQLAKAWVSGHAVEWAQLHAPQARKRLSLPGYVYQRQRYWVTKPGVVATSAALHPLIDSNVSTLEEQTFRKTFRAEEFFLRDHQLGSNRILPGVAYLEMALAAGRLGSSEPVCALRDVQWLKPIFVNEGSSSFDIGLIPAADGVHFEIYQAHGDTRQIYSQGMLEFGASPLSTSAGMVDLHAIIGRCQMQSREAIAAAFTQMGFNFGPSFQVFDVLHFNADEALAQLSQPTQLAMPAVQGFTLPPALLDGAVRTALGIGGLGFALRGVHAPVRLQRIEVLLPIVGSCFAHARRANVEARHADQHSYDIDLLDAAGRVLARIEQLVIQAAPSLGLSRSPAKVSEPVRRAAIAAITAATPASAQPRLSVATSGSDNPEALQAAVVTHLVGLLSTVTKVPAEQIDPKSALENYGIDSVMILALTEKLHPTFGEVPKTLFYEYQDLHSLSEYFLDSHTEQVRGLAAVSPVLAAAPALQLTPQPMPQPIDAISAPAGQEAQQAAVVAHLVELLSTVTKVPAEQIDPKSALENYGIDSVMILTLTEKLHPTFGEVPKTLFYEYQDLHSLSEYFLDSHAEQVRSLAATSSNHQSAPSPQPETIVVEVADLGPAALRSRLFVCLRETLGDDARNCTDTTALAEWPIDPISHVRLMHALRQEFGGIDIGPMYRHATLDDWAAAIWAAAPQPVGRAVTATVGVSTDADTAAPPSAVRTTGTTGTTASAPGFSRFSTRFAQAGGTAMSASHQDQEIAIIGLSGRYPGARNVEEFWQNLSAGRDSITEIPLSRWDHQKHYHPDRNAKGQVYSKWGGFIDDIDQFDAGFFSISPREAEITDPQERLFLQTAWECLEDACYTRQALKDRDVGVFVGVMWGHYEAIDVSEQQRKYGRPAALSSSIANRVSYFLNLNGPSVALDTMCSSSLTAIHLASQAIRNGDCQMAIAGGVNLIVHPLKYQLLAQGQFLSTDGRCRAFGDGGDGYVPGEGVGAVLLKPLRQAIEDGDQIHAVIKASAVNHGGKTNGYTVPNQVAQSNVIGKALRRAGWHPSSIDYIEAHGTGTSLGDPIEIAGLSKAFNSAAQDMEKQARGGDVGDGGSSVTAQSCRIGSVKTNIGHLESAAGMAALTKILLQMRHRRIAPSLHSTLLNTNIDFAKTPFRVVQALEDWHAPARPGASGKPASRRAGISSFGAGGANAHVLIEEYEAAAAITMQHVPASLPQPLLFVLSADSEERLTLYIDRVLAFLVQHQQGGSTLDLRSLAYSSLIGREAMNERLAVVISSLDDLIDALAQYRQGVVVNQVQRGSVKKHSEKLDAILDETQRDAMVRSLLQDKRLPQLAKAWVSLLDIEWSRYADLLFAADPASARSTSTASVRRLSFPVMPFLTKRHWVEEKPAATDAIRHDALHPLLDRNVSTLTQQRYAKLLTGQEFYLRDHIVEAGQKRVILPGVTYLEMARAAGELAMGEEWSVDRIRNLIWIQPVEIKDAPEEVTVTLTQVDDAVEFDITRSATKDVSVEGELHYRRRDEAVADEWLDLDALRSRGVIEADKQAIYDSFRRMGFHYGSSYQVTETRYRMTDGALSRLRLPEFLWHDAMAFCLHPSLFDGALRTCLAIGSESLDATVPLVPFALGELEIRHPLTEECYAYATAVVDAEMQADPHSGLRKYNIVVTDSDGRVLIKLWNFSARQLIKAEPQASRALQYYGYDWLETSALPALASTLSGRTILVIADDTSLAETLSLRFASSANVVLAQPGAAFAKLGERHYRFDPASAHSYTELLTHLASQDLRPSHIAHYLQDVQDFTAAVDHDDVQSLRRGILSMRHLFNALEQAMLGQSVRCAYVFEATREAIQPQHDAISGYARSLLTINHRFELFTLRSDHAETAELAAALQSEFDASGTLTGLEIAHWNGRRYLRSLTPFDPSGMGMAQNALPLKSRGVYLITGGAGKLGLVLARYLATHYQARLILSGRSERLHDEALAQIEALRAVGAEVHYHCSNIAQAGQADALLAVAKQVYGRLDGVLHCAGVASDTLITQLDEMAFADLLAPKIDGLLALDRATRSEPLDFFVNFSSVSAMLGDLGSGAYAVANRFMDSHAVWRDALCRQGQRFGKSLSIGWPLWATGGMKISLEDASLFNFSGMSALTEDEGIEAFERLLRGDMQQVLLAVGDAAKIGRALRVQGAVGSHAEPAPAIAQAAPRALPIKTVLTMASTTRTVGDHNMTALPSGSSSGAIVVNTSDQQGRAEHYIKERLAIVVKVAASDIAAHTTFEQLGMDSVMLMELRNSLTQDFPGLPKTALFEYDTPARLAQYLMQQHADALRTCLGGLAPTAADETIATSLVSVSASVAAVASAASVTSAVAGPRPAALPVSGKRRATTIGAAAAADDAVAIIGLAGQFPQAADLGEFWSNLQQAKDCLSPIPEDRWPTTANGQRDARRDYCNKGGFLSDADRFDPAFFRMSQSEAAKTDPQLRVLLRAAWHAIEDAAYTPEALLPERVGVYVGAMNEDFTWIMSELYARTGEYQGPGSVVSELANRISFLMNFRGPSLTVSTACSSSLTAVHMARQSILGGECDMALAGGVNLSLHPSKYLMLQDMKVLSPDGQERTFDEAANGLVPSEGVGMVLLKRLSRALADGDQIYGVIRGSSISHAGTGAGQYLPNLKVLEETAVRSLRESGLRAEDLSYIESHGTGTELGDPIELKALANALRQSTSAERFCAIGTKANLGHMEAASGVCSLIKVLLSMKHGHLSPCAKLTSVNSSFEHEFSPFHFPREPQLWNVNQRGTRAAGINSFGMGGSNVFVVLESRDPATSRQNRAGAQVEPSIVVLSAKSEDRLRAYASALLAFLAHGDCEAWSTADFSDMAYSSQIGRSAFEHRLAIVATDRLELIAKVNKYLQSGPVAALGIFADGARSPDGLPDLLAGNAGREFIDALLQSRQWDKLASIWTRGCAVDWPRLHLNASRRRVSFPAYPFDTIRCDLGDAGARGEHGKRQVALETGTAASSSVEVDALPQNAAAEDELQGNQEWFSLEATPNQALQDAEGSADEGDEMARQYWIGHLQDIADSSFLLAPALLPEYVGQDAAEELPAHFVSDSLGRELTRSLQRCTQLHRIEVETLIAAAWAILINRYTKVRCSQFGILKAFTPGPNAATGSDADSHEPLHNFVPVRICTAGREKIAGWLTGLQRNLNRKRIYAHVPIHRIESWIGVESLFDNAIAFEKSHGPQADATAVAALATVSRAPLPACVAMKLTVTIHSDALDFNLTYRSAKAEDEKLSTLLDHFQVLLEGLAANPEKTPAALTMRTKRESRETFWKTMDKVNR